MAKKQMLMQVLFRAAMVLKANGLLGRLSLLAQVVQQSVSVQPQLKIQRSVKHDLMEFVVVWCVA